MALFSVQRSRIWLSIGIFAVIALGLASRKFPLLFPTFLGKYPGDMLWALTIMRLCIHVDPFCKESVHYILVAEF